MASVGGGLVLRAAPTLGLVGPPPFAAEVCWFNCWAGAHVRTGAATTRSLRLTRRCGVRRGSTEAGLQLRYVCLRDSIGLNEQVCPVTHVVSETFPLHSRVPLREGPLASPSEVILCDRSRQL